MSEKLQKVLARAGFGSRREIEEWIKHGRVKVNGKVAEIGERVNDEDKVVVGGIKLASQHNRQGGHRVLLYNKPENEICTRKDPEGRPTVFDKLPAVNRGCLLYTSPSPRD